MRSKLGRAYLHQLLCTPLTWLSIGMIAFTSSLRLLYASQTIKDTVYAFELLFYWDAFRKLLPLFAALPFAPQFAKEWNSKIFDFVMNRSGFRSYVRTQVLVCSTASFLVCFLGLLLYIGICCCVKPFYLHEDARVAPPYGFFLAQGLPLLYLLVKTFIFSLSCSLWSMCGMVLSAIFPNIYVAFCTPFICSYLVEHLTDKAPAYLRFFTIAIGLEILPDKGTAVNFFYSVGFFLIWILLLAMLFRYIIGKRVRNELR